MAVSRQTWQYSDTGILRKKEDDEELLVFGYSCKLFRDDEKALFIDQGKHLIPWMGDESLKIDRYDGRGALYDLRQYETPTGGFDRLSGLSDAERKVEQMCDEERYRALLHNEEEEALYQEEELKRLHQALSADTGNTYGQVAYSYDDGVAMETNNDADQSTKEDSSGDEPFVPPPELDIPINMTLPDTVKANAIIEKTAMFISEQGPQMEILLKMKQANNPQFRFLSFDCPLHQYYRLLLLAIKNGRYRPHVSKEEEEENQHDEDEHYLHPALASSSSRVELAPSIPSINYKPSADCAYSMLVTKIRDQQAALAEEKLAAAEEHQVPSPAAATSSRHSADDTESSSSSSSSRSRHARSESESSSSSGSEKEDEASVEPAGPAFVMPPPDMQLIIDKMASYVAKNGRDFEVIVKSKGDTRFMFLEATHEHHAYYQHKVAFYEAMDATQPKTEDEASQDAPSEPQQPNSPDSDDSKLDDDDARSRLKPAPVCFSIKPKESDCPLEIKSALPIEESTDEEEEEEGDGEKDPEKEKEREREREKRREERERAREKERAKEKERLKELKREEKLERQGGVEEKSKKNKWEERVKDKLAAAAREKLAASIREKQLQLERKRRAAAFINMIKKEHPLGSIQDGGNSETNPLGDAIVDLRSDDDDVTSLPPPTPPRISSPKSPHTPATTPPPPTISRSNGEVRLKAPKENGEAHESSHHVSHMSSKSHSHKRSKHSKSSSESRSRSRERDRHRHKHKRRRYVDSHRRSRSHSRPRSYSYKRHEDSHSRSKKPKKHSRSRSLSSSRVRHSRSHMSIRSSRHHGPSRKRKKDKHKRREKKSKNKSKENKVVVINVSSSSSSSSEDDGS